MSGHSSSEYNQEYYRSHKDVIRKQKQERYLKNRDNVLEESKKYYREHKEAKALYRWMYFSKDHGKEVIRKSNSKRTKTDYRGRFLEMYGNKCECCGEDEPRFLTLDHIQGQVGVIKKEHGFMAYKTACQEYRPDLYRVLCMNCNFAVKFGECPHQMKGENR